MVHVHVDVTKNGSVDQKYTPSDPNINLPFVTDFPDVTASV